MMNKQYRSDDFAAIQETMESLHGLQLESFRNGGTWLPAYVHHCQPVLSVWTNALRRLTDCCHSGQIFVP